jgi:hypothetical protein
MSGVEDRGIGERTLSAVSDRSGAWASGIGGPTRNGRGAYHDSAKSEA